MNAEDENTILHFLKDIFLSDSSPVSVCVHVCMCFFLCVYVFV